MLIHWITVFPLHELVTVQDWHNHQNYEEVSMTKCSYISRVCMLVCIITLAAGQSFAGEIVFAHGAKPGTPRYDAANMFAVLVAQSSHGKITVNVADSATLGDDAEMLKSVKAGTIQVTANSQGSFSQYIPEVGALGLPFLFANLPQAWAVLDGDIGRELKVLALKKGFVVLGWWDDGIRNIFHVSKAIKSPADVKGMKIRTPPDKATLDAFKALGANPAPLAWNELPTALRNGTFEGQENSLTHIYSACLHEITPYIALSAHKYEVTPVVANARWWKSLSKDDKGIIKNAMVAAGWYQRGRNMIDAVTLVDTLKQEGAKFSNVDTAAFQKETASVYDLWEKDLGAFVPRLKKAAVEAAK